MTALSLRLEAMLAMLDPCRVLVDVGTDHALLPIAAVERGIAARAIASDLREPPLRAARRTLRSSKARDRLLLLREDGLSALARGAVDAVSMAGMSGALMVQLCQASAHVLEGVGQLVLQPNSDAVLVRAWALRYGWHLREERMVLENGQFFTLCALRPGLGARDPAYALPGWSDAQLCLVGPLLLAHKDPVLLRFCVWQCERLGALVERAPGLAPELSTWRAALEQMAHQPGRDTSPAESGSD
ncbi:MAG TPA: class I SAM-dependent methyltransferase [Polyangiales bacterium]